MWRLTTKKQRRERKEKRRCMIEKEKKGRRGRGGVKRKAGRKLKDKKGGWRRGKRGERQTWVCMCVEIREEN